MQNLIKKFPFLLNSYVYVFLLALAVTTLLNYLFGAPYLTTDSWGYIDAAQAPSILVGGWHPPGFIVIIKFLTWLGLGHFGIVSTMGALLTLAFYALMRRMCGPRAALWGTLIFQLLPIWTMLRGCFWSESIFTAFVLVIALVVALPLSFPWRLGLSVILWLVSIEIRHAGFFILPALIVALGIRQVANTWKWDWKRLVLAATLCLSCWSAGNYLKTGSLNGQSSTRITCFSLVFSLNFLPYCEWDPSISVCKYDPQRTWINRPWSEFHLSDGFYSNPMSPVNQLLRADSPAAICTLKDEIIKKGIVHHPAPFVKLIAIRVWEHLGKWTMAEQGSNPDPNAYQAFRLNPLVESTNTYNKVARWAFFLFLALLVFYRSWNPVSLFCFLAGVGHMMGIVIINPFTALRYMAISQLFIILGFIFMFWDVRSQVKKSFSKLTWIKKPSDINTK